MNNDFLDPPRHRGRLILAGIAVLAVLTAVGVVILMTTDGDYEDRTITPGTSAQPSTSGEVLGVDPADLGALTVQPGSRIVDEVSVGYPHTIPGAVSAAVEYWSQHGSTLDPERARTIARIVADPAWTDAEDTFARGAINMRAELGVPADGDVPDGTSVVLTPVAYQLREATDNSMIVLLLSYFTTQTPKTGSHTNVGVFPSLMVWAAEDWKTAEFHRGDEYLYLAETPGSTAAEAAGWKGLTR